MSTNCANLDLEPNPYTGPVDDASTLHALSHFLGSMDLSTDPSSMPLPFEVRESRNSAIVAACQAVERIARRTAR